MDNGNASQQRDTHSVSYGTLPIDTLSSKPPHARQHHGRWLPSRDVISGWVGSLRKQCDFKRPLSPSVAAFKKLLEENWQLMRLAEKMITEVPRKYSHNPSHNPCLKSVDEMLCLINQAIRSPPPFQNSELVGFPINAILDWTMGTEAGAVFYLNKDVNVALQGILNEWAQYLNSRESLEAFTSTGGWSSNEALAKLKLDEFEVPDSENRFGGWGFSSWNEFFTRKFKPGRRPVADPDDPTVIVNACESSPYSIQTHVEKKSTFWAKEQCYSLQELLCGWHVDEFAGGTVYQAFLDAFSYHRWNSPVAGKIVEAFIQPGTYYAETPVVGFDVGGPNLSQGYIAHTAARAIIFIDAEPPVGLMAFVSIGMAEVSSNVITVKQGDTINKGDELGYFQFGGSTHCLVFCPGVIQSFDAEVIPCYQTQSAHRIIPVGARLATAWQSKKRKQPPT